ncbi:hypothetical protein ABFS83_08G213300 [Erythranthe nasuta]
MASFKVNVCVIFYVFLFVSMSLNLAEGRAPVPPSSGSPCTYIPGNPGRGNCIEMHVSSGGAAYAPPPPPPSPAVAVVDFQAV